MDNQQIKDNLLKNGAASKIYDELKKLRDSSSEDQERSRKRWIWELIQNAVDCCRFDDTIDIVVDFDGSSTLIFSHNGRGFDKENLWSIVLQTSNKSTDTESRGKFGTGFISTTLISPKITIDSFLESTKERVLLNLDRSGESVEDLRQSIDENVQVIEALEEKVRNESWNSNNRTYFIYDLSDLANRGKSIEAINDGIESLEEYIVYLLSFNDKISSIECNGKKYSVKERIAYDKIPHSAVVKIIEEKSQIISALIIVDFENGSIAVPLYTDGDVTKFYKISSKIPRLFCDFPLIGTENYPFPVILNSSNFSVEIDRNAIYETDATNIEIMNYAVQAYGNLLQYFSSFSNMNVFNICNFVKNEITTYKKNVSQKITDIILNKNIVLTSKGQMQAILDSEGNKQIVVPKEKADVVDGKLWNLLSEIPNINIPTKEFVEEWRPIINNNITTADINNEYLKGSTINKFKEWFGSGDVIKWLNDYYQYVEEDKRIDLVLPNSEGVFKELKDLKLVDDIIPELLTIYLQIKPEFKKYIVLDGIIVPDTIKHKIPSCNNQEISEEVANHVHALLSKEKKESRTAKTEGIFKQILDLFSQNTQDWNELFPSLYSDRSKLRSQQFDEELKEFGDLLVENNWTVEKAKSIFFNDDLLDAISTLGEELSEEQAQQLKHTIKNSFYAKEKVNNLINRSVQNVYNHLSQNPKYQVPNTFEEWNNMKLSTTVFKAWRNDKKIDLLIVIRPIDEEKIIFYEEQELSALDSNKYELWTDDGQNVKELTLGDILKTTNITTIPLRNIFGENK